MVSNRKFYIINLDTPFIWFTEIVCIQLKILFQPTILGDLFQLKMDEFFFTNKKAICSPLFFKEPDHLKGLEKKEKLIIKLVSCVTNTHTENLISF